MSITEQYAARMTSVTVYIDAKVDPSYENIFIPDGVYETQGQTRLVFDTMYSLHPFGSRKAYIFGVGGNAYGRDSNFLSFVNPFKGTVRLPLNTYGTNQNFPKTISELNELYNANYMYIHNSATSESIERENPTPYMELMSDPAKTDPPMPGTTETSKFYDRTRDYFCFIKKIQYVNDFTIEVEFEVDLIQTYFRYPSFQTTSYVYNYDFLPCFVEREHANSDAIGDNIVEENLNTGDYIVAGDMTDMLGDWMVMVMASEQVTGDLPTPQTLNNIFTPVTIYAGIRVTQPQQVQEIIDVYMEEGRADSIIAIQQYPASFGTSEIATVTEPQVTIPTTIDGYTPKNNKLFIYPYNFMVVDNRCGNTATFKWELWNNANARGTFKRYSSAIGNPTAMVVPQNYRGISGDDYQSALIWRNAPVCPFSSDAYKAYWAQNKNQIQYGSALNLAGALGSGALAIGGLMTGNIAMSMGGALGFAGSMGGVYNRLAKILDYDAVPAQQHGQIFSDYLMAGKNLQGFVFYKMQIRAQMARVIDDYFSAYGYATHRVKVPNIGLHSRRANYSYVKTQGCQLTGQNIPAQAKAEIESIFNKGVRVWKNIDTYLDMSVNNNIV